MFIYKKIIILFFAIFAISCSSQVIFLEDENKINLSKKENRFNDENIKNDLEYFNNIQKKLYDISEKKYNTTSYPYCLAQSYLDKAYEQYNNNDRSDYVRMTLENSLNIINQIEKSPDSINYPIEKNDKYTVRSDLWNLVNNTRVFYDLYGIRNSFECGQCKLAELEVELINAQHLNSELGFRNALPSIRKSEYLSRELNNKILSCKNNELYKIIDKRIFFDNDSFELTDISYKKLNVILSIIKNNEYKVKINGYTDPNGENNYNLLLSQKRAKEVYNFFVKNGIKHNITLEGKGEKYQIKDSNKVDNYAINRRVDIEIIK